MKKTRKEDLKKKDEEGEEEEGEEEEGEEEEGEEEEEKSEDLTSSDLEKSIQILEDIAASGDTTNRKDFLLEKAQTEDLSKSEKDELYTLLGGEVQEEDALSDQVVKGLEENDELVKALDVSEYLEEQHAELTKSLEVLSDYVETGSNRQHQFNLVLAKAVSETGRMVKAMAEKLQVIEQQPARGPKARLSGAQPMEKGFQGQRATATGDLSKSQILDTMEDMMVKSVEAGRGGATEDGIDIATAASKFEQFGMISPSLLNHVKTHLQGAN